MASLRLLGPVDLRDDSGRELHQLLGQPKRFALLAYLAGNVPHVFHRRDRLLALLWPESTTHQAQQGLRQVLYELRNHLGEDVIVRRGAGEIALNEDIVTCDVAQLHAALAEGNLDRATELYRGPFLEGFFVSGAPELEQWIASRRAEILRQVVTATWTLVEHREAQGDRTGARNAAERAVELSPTDEVGVRRLLGLLEGQGNSGEALRVYERLARRLAEEFVAVPSPETTALIARIREAGGAGEPERAAAAPSPPRSSAPEPDVAGTTARWNHPVAAAALFGIVSLGIVGVVNLVMLQLGLPDWVLRAAVGLLIVGLPIIVATAFLERQRMAGADRPLRAELRWLTWPRAVQGGGMAFTSLAAVTAGFMGLRVLGIGPAGTLIAKGVLEPRDPILLAEFASGTADTTLATTVTNLLRVDLSRSRVVRLVDPAAVAAALRRMGADPDGPLSEAQARHVAEREGLKAVLAGEVSPAGPGYVLSARLISPAAGALLVAERVTAEDETELIRAIDRLSDRLREHIGESLKDVRADPPLERVTTTSLPALRKYTQAVGRAGLADGQLAEVRLLEQAVALDSNFAMAYRRLGGVLMQTGRPDPGRAAVRRAFALRDRLPEVEQKIVAGMYHANVEYDASAIETAYRSALALDPDNYIALINLAEHQARSRQWAEQESLALRSTAVQRTLVGFLTVFSAQLLQRKFATAEATMSRFAGEGDVRANWQFDLETARREYDRAEQVLREDMAHVDWHRFGDLLRLRGRLGEAERVFRDRMTNMVGASRPYFDAMYHLASLEADHGAVSDAIRMLDRYPLDSLSPVEQHYLERAEFYAGVGRVDRARALVADFEQHADAALLRHPDSRRALLRVSGEIALSEGRFDDAVTDFRIVNELSGTCTTCGLARLAYALEQSGRDDSALSVVERMLSMPTHGLNDDDARWLPDSYRRLGELYEARHDTANAINAYNQFVQLWNKADPKLQPQVENVRRRIARFVREPRLPPRETRAR